MAGCVLAVDGGSYGHRARLYLRHIKTGEVKIVVPEAEKNRVGSLSEILMRMLPEEYRWLLFDGIPARLVFKKEAFHINGEVAPWNATKIYPGSKAHKTQNHDL